MNKDNKVSEIKDVIRLKNLLEIFSRRKWIFLGFFFTVLITGLLFTFIKTPLYQSCSILKLKDIYYDENLYKYFPQESQKLGIVAPGLNVEELESSIIKDINESLRDDMLLKEVAGKMDFQVTKDEMNDSITTLVDSSNREIRVIVTYNNADSAYQINSTLINNYLDRNRTKRSEIIEGVILDIYDRIDLLQGQYEEIKIKNQTKSDKLDDADERDLDSINSLLIDLNKIKYNLENNKEVYINNMDMSEEPSVVSEPINMDNLKSILVTIFAAVVTGLIAVYIPNVFISSKEWQ
jgi:uncharacterized protein involved in exopolysaccharide biosynthesis